MPGYFAAEYGLPDDEDLQALMETLDGYAMRDVQPTPGFPDRETQRRELRDAAKAILKHASVAQNHIAQLKAALTDFHRCVGDDMWSALMLEEVFEIEPIPPGQMDPPELFDVVWGPTVTNAEQWQTVSEDLQALAALPMRDLRNNKVANHALRSAMEACKSYWEGQGRKWSTSTANHKDVKRLDQSGELSGSCERFVADMLNAARIPFTVRNLNAMFVTIARSARRTPSRSKGTPSGEDK